MNFINPNFEKSWQDNQTINIITLEDAYNLVDIAEDVAQVLVHFEALEVIKF